jgi:hypothetical protein
MSQVEGIDKDIKISLYGGQPVRLAAFLTETVDIYLGLRYIPIRWTPETISGTSPSADKNIAPR